MRTGQNAVVLTTCDGSGRCTVEDSGFAETDAWLYWVKGRDGQQWGPYCRLEYLWPTAAPSELPDGWTENLDALPPRNLKA